MRTIDGDHLRRWILSRMFKTRLSVADILDQIDREDTIEPERKLGEWKGYNADESNWRRNDGTPIFLICSKCNGMVINNGSAHWNYCPKCGEKKVTEWMQIQY